MANMANMANTAGRDMTRDPNYVYPDDGHVCACPDCDPAIRRLYDAPSNGEAVTMYAGRTPGAFTYWECYFPDGHEALHVMAYFTGIGDTPPWALQVSFFAPTEGQHRTAGIHRCHGAGCAGNSPCMRVTHEPLALRYVGQSFATTKPAPELDL